MMFSSRQPLVSDQIYSNHNSSYLKGSQGGGNAKLTLSMCQLLLSHAEQVVVAVLLLLLKHIFRAVFSASFPTKDHSTSEV